ncbi:hypothetical protein ABFS82_12G006400 [Erythranthe guttata]
MFNSTMATSSQFQNPNCNNQVPYSLDQFNDSPYFRIAKYLLSNEDEGSGENLFSENENISENFTTNRSDSSSDPVPLSRRNVIEEIEMQNERIVKFAFRTKTELEFMDDGYKWRKYGKKMVKSSPNPRNYFKCSSGGCNVKKRVERDSVDQSYVISTYHGIHNHEIP